LWFSFRLSSLGSFHDEAAPFFDEAQTEANREKPKRLSSAKIKYVGRPCTPLHWLGIVDHWLRSTIHWQRCDRIFCFVTLLIASVIFCGTLQ
jgi:hypothetical protein